MGFLLLTFLFACKDPPADSGEMPRPVPDSSTHDSDVPGPATPPNTVDIPGDAVRVALLGDFGDAGPEAAAVADLVDAFDPDAILTTGDNNYPVGSIDTMDENVGQYYAAYIAPYVGAYGPGGTTNRFWPSLGNHDWDLGNIDGYTSYFTLPGNERYYAVDLGFVEAFAVDADPREPDGTRSTSKQADWLRDALAASTAPWKIVYLHQPPFSSGSHGENPNLHWPWGAWGAQMVWGGHDHDYERIERDGLIFGVNGISGTGLRSITRDPVPGSTVAWKAEHGATFLTFTEAEARARTIAVSGTVIDDFTVPLGRSLGPVQPVVHERSVWRYLDTGVAPSADWTLPGFDDAAWKEGHGELGYGDGDEHTVVGWGVNAADKHPTTWFRHAFTVAEPAGWDGGELTLLANDGAVVYLNGVEIARAGLPAGAITPDTLATVDVTVEAPITLSVPIAALVEGENVLAVEVHVAAPNASDLGFDLSFGLREDDRLVPFGATWRYDDDGGAPDPDWTTASFDDSAWPSGAAPLGFGGVEPVATPIDVGGDPEDRKPTTWYRHAFEVEDASTVDALLLELIRVDAAVVWLNGVEVWRLGVPDGRALPASRFADAEILDDWETKPVRTFLDPDLLVTGTNVVAVAVRVAGPDREVHRFDLSLVPFL